MRATSKSSAGPMRLFLILSLGTAATAPSGTPAGALLRTTGQRYSTRVTAPDHGGWVSNSPTHGGSMICWEISTNGARTGGPTTCRAAESSIPVDPHQVSCECCEEPVG